MDEKPKLDLERAGEAGLLKAPVDLIGNELLGGQEGRERFMTRSVGGISAGLAATRTAAELMPEAKHGRTEEPS